MKHFLAYVQGKRISFQMIHILFHPTFPLPLHLYLKYIFLKTLHLSICGRHKPSINQATGLNIGHWLQSDCGSCSAKRERNGNILAQELPRNAASCLHWELWFSEGGRERERRERECREDQNGLLALV